VFVGRKPAGTVALRAGRAIPAASTFDRVRDFVDNNLVPLALAMFVILMVGVLLYRRLTRGNEQRGRNG
ncbi:MAG: hypothetical protein WBL45_00740, partial [Solirubrobacterales bacterium]